MSKAKLYVAASYPRRTEARMLAENLREEGFDIVSRWLYADEGYGLEHPGGVGHLLPAQRDEEDVRSADCIIQLTGDTLTRGGRHSELGMAIILGKPVVLVGPREQVFHAHPAVKHVIENFATVCSDITPLIAKACWDAIAGPVQQC